MNQKEIANTLNISVSTVSLALRGSPKVKKETRKKIEKLAQLSKYRPHLGARGLLLGKTYTVGVVLEQFSDPFFAELVEETHHFLTQENYVGIFFPVNNPQGYHEAIEILLSRRVDGIISMMPAKPEEIVKLKDEAIPVVFYEAQSIPTDYVEVDIYKGGFLATTHLINLGHRKIGFLCMRRDDEERFLGYKDALYQNNLPLKREWITSGGGYREVGYKGMKKILSLKERPTAVFAFTDMAAIGAMRAISEAGLAIPHDIAIVGFDNDEESKYGSVPLTTVDLLKEKLAEKLVDTVFHRIENKNQEPLAKIVLGPKLIIRQSCGFYRKKGGLEAGEG